ncbi:PssE/Cps14G family polysaccharide biosynthesis glycosyltransferase [Niallia taxi]|uniref:PssE/Cps14G family polysaccharide biosynthesis glycosyltransferase n=1 Tax=Niallia taxi TaxID=2499688 RepID=UPI002E1B2BAE|nr:PssE/Cps14G family polysaccharide biosynthesis glycosyltransferase [Niallia taxi]MED4054190.1 PssE/Cps14G family polysaccharide biosynthesis glycosyltransferase [Niallia taxi]MED4118290.1 PssE/Cps14G family polysaccharide biosynthesis glycosyltransferase [Niallia taxi]
MIFVILGTQKFKMNRLIDEIDKLIEKKLIASNEIILQSGFSRKSKYAESFEMISEDEFDSLVEKCSLVITHGGTSAIIKALKQDKKVIAIPRLSKYKEHVDDHQLEIVSVFQEKGYLEVCENINDLEFLISKVEQINYEKYVSTGNLGEVIVSDILK